MLKFLIGCLIGTTLSASAIASDSVARFEMALGFVPGQTTRVIPALGATVRYIRTVESKPMNGHPVFAVYIEKLD